VPDPILITSVRGQSIDGFGVNLNAIDHWRGGRLRAVLDLLIDDLGAHLFRVDPYGRSDFLDPGELRSSRGWNERVEERAFRHPDLLDSWASMRHLEARGASVLVSLSGLVPPSLCAADGVTLTDFERFADLVVSFLRWARESEGLRIDALGPVNETDIGPPEGPWLDPQAAAEMLSVLGPRLAEAGVGDTALAVFDQAIYDTRWLEALLARPELHELVSIFSYHKYTDRDFSEARRLLDAAGPVVGDWKLWLTEYGDLDQSGEREWDVALAQSRRLIGALLDGVRAAIVWDAYDNLHKHDDSWSIYGLLRTGDRQSEIGYPEGWPLVGYLPKPRYYAARHVYRFVPPGSERIELEGGDRETVAFTLPDGGLTVVALNESAQDKPLRLAGELPALELYVSDERRRCEHAGTQAAGPALDVTVPASGLVTLSSVRADSRPVDVSARV
jgi:hypothetical protein